MDFESLLEALLYVKSTITMPVSQFFFKFFIFRSWQWECRFQKKGNEIIIFKAKYNIFYK